MKSFKAIPPSSSGDAHYPHTHAHMDGECSDTNAYFFVYFIGSAFCAACINYFRNCMLHPPKVHKSNDGHTTHDNPPPSSASADLGRPYAICILLLHITLWSMAPPTAYFILFHVVSTSLLAMQQQSACIALLNVPFIAVILLVQGGLLMVFYKAGWMKDAIGGAAFPSPVAASSQAAIREGGGVTKCLVLGMVGHGSVFLDGLQKEMSGRLTNVEVHGVEFDHSRVAIAFVHYNATVYGVQDALATRFHSSVWRGRNKFLLPFDDASFDRVILSPGIRHAPPVGDVVTPDDTAIPRMARLLREAMRVLKPDGELFYSDQAMAVVTVWADFHDAGFDGSVISDPNTKAGPIGIFEAPLLELRLKWSMVTNVPPQKGVSILSPGASSLSSNSPAVSPSVASPFYTLEGMPMDDEDDATMATTISKNRLYLTLVAYQTTMFIVLCFATTALYEPLSIPSSIPLSTRLNKLLVSIATGYPMMAYFSRVTTMDSEGAPRTLRQLARRCFVTETLAVLGSAAFTMILGFPGFALQVVLADTTLSDSAKNIIGILISIFIGYAVFKFFSGARKRQLVAKRGADAYAKYL